MSRSNTVREPNTAPAPQANFVTRFAALVQAMRPKQWTKNGLLFAGLIFTLDRNHSAGDYLNAVLAFGIFCLLSGCVYLLNDVVDVEADRQHPRKRLRPIASGRLPIPMAVTAVVLLAPLSLYLAWGINLKFFAASLLYFGITLAYSFAIKHMVLLDVLTIAAGFVIRAAAGSFAVGVRNSEWLLICTTLLALFLGFTKRRAEITALGDNPSTRRILSEYTVPMLDQMITIVASACLMAYSLYTFFSIDPNQGHRPYLMATIPFVIYGLFRYLYLTHQKGSGEAPDVVLLEDRPLQIDLLLYILTTVVVVLWAK